MTKKILLVDMHNTLVDEMAEYGLAIDAALDTFLKFAQRAHTLPEGFNAEQFKQDVLFPALKKAHIALNDDWDNRAFNKEYQPELYRLLGGNDARYERARSAAVIARKKFSRNHTVSNAYPGALETIKKAKEEGHAVYIVTDANAVGAEATLSWLGLDGVIDALFCPNSKPQESKVLPRLRRTPVVAFSPGVYKPDACIVADVLTYHARKEALDIPWNTEHLFDFKADPMLPAAAPDSVKNKLVIKDTPYKDALRGLLNRAIGIGDDARDRLLFHNAGITNVAADYGKPDENNPAVKRGKEIMKAVSGWSPERLNLVSTIGGKSHIDKTIVPDLRCAHSLTEIAPLLDDVQRPILTSRSC